MREELLALLSRLLTTHSPSGCEREMEELCLTELEPLCSRVWRDEAGNVIGLIEGSGNGPAVRLMAHKDEISALVARIEEDGKLRLEPLGGSLPWVYGEGPLDVLGDEVVTGILGIGSKHVSALSADVYAAKTSQPLSWDKVRLDCKLTPAELAKRGITIGTRVCLSRSRKTPTFLGDYVAAYALDDKAAVAALLLAARMLKQSNRKPKQDTYFCLTSAEEPGCVGGIYAARSLPGDIVIAVDVAPVAPEYPVEAGPRPVVFYMDAIFIYDKPLADSLCALSAKLGHEPQRMVVRGYGSDASAAAKNGLAGRSALIGFPTENTHGCEIAHLDGLLNCAELVASYVVGTSVRARRPPAKKGGKKRG
ncbi:MAG: M42 family metallopeptidase [Armatimonadetes bacterium]|nr:M42 family metallopeptidase [Armatimonadota bacterium]